MLQSRMSLRNKTRSRTLGLVRWAGKSYSVFIAIFFSSYIPSAGDIVVWPISDPVKSNGELCKYSYVIGNIIILLFQTLEYELRTLFRSAIPGYRLVW